jgi:hypothetical protein
MLELIYSHAPNVFGDVREDLMAEYPDFFAGEG